MQRHLSAFESDTPGLGALAGTGTLLTTTAGRAPAGTSTATDALATLGKSAFARIDTIELHD